MKKTGLYLGKFAPLHEGHEYVIEKALDEVDELVLLMYDVPDIIDIPPTRRKSWVEEKYPNVTVKIAWTGPTEEGYNEETKRMHENYVSNRLSEYNFTHFYSSEPYGGHMSEGLGAKDIRVDPSREEVPISGTKVRNNSFKNREFVSDIVYFDMLDKISVIGGPSTGKTTLCRKLSEELDTVWNKEYGRVYWENNDVELPFSKKEMLEITKKQRKDELENCKGAKEYYITDTNALTIWVWSMRRHDNCLPQLEEEASKVGAVYDYIIMCDDDIPFEKEEGRMSKEDRTAMQRMHESFLNDNSINYKLVSGTIEDRVEQVKDYIS